MSDCPPNPPLPPYVPAGSGGGGCLTDVELLFLCDITGGGDEGPLVYTPFVRRLVVDCSGATVAALDFEPDGVTSYTVAGTVGECQCEPAAGVVVVPRQSVLSGVGSFALPATALSVTVIARNVGATGSVTVTTTDGPVALTDGQSVFWSVVRPQDSILGGVLSVATTNVADDVHIVWAEAT